jgi:Flp pilus assembly protein TadG
MKQKRELPGPYARSRRGSATLWLIIWLPCLLTLFCVLVGVANLWLARIELENALEAAALAAAKEWGQAGGGDTQSAREAGVAFAAANMVRGNPVVLGTNYNSLNAPNDNDVGNPTGAAVNPPNGNLVFGAINDDDPDHVIFDASGTPSCAAAAALLVVDPAVVDNSKFGVRAQAILSVQPLNLGFLGTLTQYCIQAKATAEYDCATGRVKLVRIDEFIFP